MSFPQGLPETALLSSGEGEDAVEIPCSNSLSHLRKLAQDLGVIHHDRRLTVFFAKQGD